MVFSDNKLLLSPSSACVPKALGCYNAKIPENFTHILFIIHSTFLKVRINVGEVRKNKKRTIFTSPKNNAISSSSKSNTVHCYSYLLSSCELWPYMVSVEKMVASYVLQAAGPGLVVLNILTSTATLGNKTSMIPCPPPDLSSSCLRLSPKRRELTF